MMTLNDAQVKEKIDRRQMNSKAKTLEMYFRDKGQISSKRAFSKFK